MLTNYSVLTWGIWISAGLFCLAIALNLYRLLIGPSLPDRIAALDTLSVNSIGPILLLGMSTGSHFGTEAGLLIALLGFLTTAALCKYVLRGMIIE